MEAKADVIHKTGKGARKRSGIADIAMRLVKEKPLGLVGGILVIILLIVGIFANFLAPYGYNELHLEDQLSLPNVKYPLGADNLGRDVLSRIIYGARISVIVGMGAALLSTLIGTILGASGFAGGKVDLTVQRFVDSIMCFPWLFLVLTITSMVGKGMIQVIFVLGLTAGIRDSRVIRSAIIGVKENIYVEAARSMGSQTWRTALRHILPNIMAPIIIVFTLDMGQAILAEATMSFLGFGIPPPTPTWGGMLNLEGRKYMLENPWLAVWPGLALSIGVYGINIFGDALRDLLDPRLRGGLGRYGTLIPKKKQLNKLIIGRKGK